MTPRSFRSLSLLLDNPAHARAKFHQGEIAHGAREQVDRTVRVVCGESSDDAPNTETPSERAARLLLERE